MEVQSRIQTICLVILTVIAVAASLYWLRPVMIPFVLAAFITLGLSAIVDFLMGRLKVPRSLALPVAIIAGVLVLLALGSLIATSVAQLADNATSYVDQFNQLVSRALGALPAELEPLRSTIQLENFSRFLISAVSSTLANTTNAVLGVLSQSFLVSIFVVFLLLGEEAGHRAPSGTWAEIERQVKSYIVMKFVISAVTGVLVGAVLSVIGVPLASAFGLFAFLLNFIPSIGSVIATLLPLPVVLGTPELSGVGAGLAIAIPGAIQMIVGNGVEPKVMGESLDLHPVVILIALIFWGMLWGIVGMLLATPITATLKILLARNEATKALAELLAGRLDSLRSPA